MKNIRIALLSAAALCSLSIVTLAESALAQPKKAAQPAKEEAAEEAADEEAAAGEGEGDEGGEGEEAEPAEPEEEAGLGSICEIDPEACPKLDFQKEAARDNGEQIYAVQQVFVLRRGRLEIHPFWGFTLNDQFVSHPGPGAALNYWITNVLAFGVNGNWYTPFNSDSEFNFQTRRAARVGVPLTEYDWAAAVNFTYAPILGKFQGFGDFIFQYDGYVVGGVGAISTRPIPVIDPDNRNFQFDTKLSFNAGLGIHLFLNRWLAFVGEGRTYVFNDKLENTTLAQGLAAQQDESTWYGEDRLTFNMQFQLGLSIFFPFSFEYRLPK
jgi:outer membrane beta-barrel protein